MKYLRMLSILILKRMEAGRLPFFLKLVSFFSLHANLDSIKSVVKEQLNNACDRPYIQKNRRPALPPVEDTDFRHLIIRVLIDEKKASTSATWELRAPHGFIIIDNEKKSSQILKRQKLIISYARGYIAINGVTQKAKFIGIKPIKSMISYKSHEYAGFFSVTLFKSTLYLVNYLDLEEYTESVLPYEGCPQWPDEFNKAFSVVVRTYGLAKVLEERASRERQNIIVPYDIKNTNIHQIYKGHKPYAHLKKIVAKTRNLVLAYNQRPILAMFDICCGGVIPAKLDGYNFSKAPYLARSYPCYYCQECKTCSWRAEYSLDQLQDILRAETPSLARYRDIKISKTDQAGLVSEIKIKGKSSWIPISGKRLKSMLKKLKSKCYTLERDGRQIIFTGKGHGHHAGLCQWGAYRMVKEGWDYKNILKFYYPGVHFMKLKVKPHASI